MAIVYSLAEFTSALLGKNQQSAISVVGVCQLVLLPLRLQPLTTVLSKSYFPFGVAIQDLSSERFNFELDFKTVSNVAICLNRFPQA